MLKTRLAVISVVHFALAPGVVVGLVPWAMTGWNPQTPPWSSPPLRVLGAAMIAVGVAVLVRLFVRFVTDGLGTPAPLVPTRHLVVGQALLLGRAGLLVYAAAVWATVAAFVRWYEEPALHERFAGSYDEYRVAVPAWWPRMHPWAPTRRFDDA
jgi:protein-S-isoprenylcysteine O-methyltransferase Ste14